MLKEDILNLFDRNVFAAAHDDVLHPPEPGNQAYGQVTRELFPSRLAPDVVEAELVRHLADQPL